MKHVIEFYAVVVIALLTLCMFRILGQAVYYIINDKELLFKFLGDVKVVGIAAGFYWVAVKFLSKLWEK